MSAGWIGDVLTKAAFTSMDSDPVGLEIGRNIFN